jgi:mandelate racemase
MSTHLYPEIAAHLPRVTETTHWLEWQDWAYTVSSELFQLQDSHPVFPGKPGLVVEWDEESVGRFALR